MRFQDHVDLVPYPLGDGVIHISFPTYSKTCNLAHLNIKTNWNYSLQTILAENKSSHCKLKSLLKQWTYLFTLPTLIHCVVAWSSKVMLPMKPCKKLINWWNSWSRLNKWNNPWHTKVHFGNTTEPTFIWQEWFDLYTAQRLQIISNRVMKSIKKCLFLMFLIGIELFLPSL